MANTYTVTATDAPDITGHIYSYQNLAVAIVKAQQLCQELPGENVFVEFFRPSDGQRGYFNSDGSVSVTGRSWQED